MRRFSNVTDQDPIFEPEAGHLHIHFGALDLTNDDTTETLREVGRSSSCHRSENGSAYWIPRIFEDGKPLDVYKGKGLGDNTLYYRAGRIDNHSSIKAFPKHLEMVARAEGPGAVRWGCGRGLALTPPDTCNTKELHVRLEFPQCFDGEIRSDESKEPDKMIDAERGQMSFRVYSAPHDYLCRQLHACG